MPSKGTPNPSVGIFFTTLLKQQKWTPRDFNKAMDWRLEDTRIYVWRKGSGTPAPRTFKEIQEKLGVKYDPPGQAIVPHAGPNALEKALDTIETATNTPRAPAAKPVIIHTINSDGSAHLR